MKLRAKLSEIISQVLEEQGRSLQVDLHATTHLRNDLGFDSLELAILTVRIDAEFGVDVFAHGIVNSLGELEERLQAKGAPEQ